MPEQVSADGLHLSPAEHRQLRDALRRPLGRYRTERAAQLSGIPARILYEWARRGILSPDFSGRPVTWSYRDLLRARLLAGLHVHSMWRDQAATHLGEIRASANGVDDALAAYAAVFDLVVSTGSSSFSRRRRLRGPNLVYPSSRTSISPAVMAGDPCVRGTRIPTATLYALAVERELGAQDITRLYPGLVVADVDDAIALEHRLRAA